jgi:hypothetical protein
VCRRTKKLVKSLKVPKSLLRKAALYEFALMEPDLQLDIIQRYLSRPARRPRPRSGVLPSTTLEVPR